VWWSPRRITTAVSLQGPPTSAHSGPARPDRQDYISRCTHHGAHERPPARRCSTHARSRCNTLIRSRCTPRPPALACQIPGSGSTTKSRHEIIWDTRSRLMNWTTFEYRARAADRDDCFAGRAVSLRRPVLLAPVDCQPRSRCRVARAPTARHCRWLTSNPTAAKVPLRRRNPVSRLNTLIRAGADSCLPDGTRISAGSAPSLQSAESEHASVQVLAASLLTIGPEQKSAALRARCSNVAAPATRSALPLRLAADSGQKWGAHLISPTT
jgi:hypothetical protein